MPKYSTIDFFLIKGNPSKIADKILSFIFFPRSYDLFSLLPYYLCTDSARSTAYLPRPKYKFPPHRFPAAQFL